MTSVHQLKLLLSAFAAVVLLLFSGFGAAGATEPWETEYRTIAMEAAARYAKPVFYRYAPQGEPHETAAVVVAVVGQLLLAGYRAGGPKAWLEDAETAADSLLAHGDMNRDGKLGWGRYWANTELDSDGRGGNTVFSRGCGLSPNRAYDDEIYDDAHVADFLLDLYGTVADRRYLDAARQVIENTWSDGTTVYGEGFMYWKTVGACSRGWGIKNINMLMAVPMARLATITGEQRYHRRLDAIMHAERHEIRRTVGGRAAPNFGYYTLQTTQDRPKPDFYVDLAQVTEPNGSVVCNPRTGAGASCAEHLPIEARAIDAVARITGKDEAGARTDAIALMAGFQAFGGGICRVVPGQGSMKHATACVAYYCALRRLDHDFDRLCHERAALAPKTPDVILGLFWGAPSNGFR